MGVVFGGEGALRRRGRGLLSRGRVGPGGSAVGGGWILFLRRLCLSRKINSGAITIPSFPRRASPWGQIVSLKPQGWIGPIGAAPLPFAPYFAKPSSVPVCRISIRTALGVL